MMKVCQQRSRSEVVFTLFVAFLSVISAFQTSQKTSSLNIKNTGTISKSLLPLHGSSLKESPTKNIPGISSPSDLPPVLQDIVDTRREYELNLGKAMDTLKKDYPHMLKKTPDFSIYDENLSVTDPSGVQLKGVNSYKNSFRFTQSLIGLFYNVEKSSITYRMVYDFARNCIRISWNVSLVPKVVGNRRNALYIDGISVYEMDLSTGKIVEHRVENMLINNSAIRPPYGVLNALIPTSQLQPAGVGAWSFNAPKEPLAN